MRFFTTITPFLYQYHSIHYIIVNLIYSGLITETTWLQLYFMLRYKIRWQSPDYPERTFALTIQANIFNISSSLPAQRYLHLSSPLMAFSQKQYLRVCVHERSSQFLLNLISPNFFQLFPYVKKYFTLCVWGTTIRKSSRGANIKMSGDFNKGGQGACSQSIFKPPLPFLFQYYLYSCLLTLWA